MNAQKETILGKIGVFWKTPSWVLDFYPRPELTFTGGLSPCYKQFYFFLWLSRFVHHELIDGGFLTLVSIVYEMVTCKCSCSLHMTHKFFSFLLWLLDYLRLSVKGIMVSLVSHEMARHDEFPYSPFIFIIRLPCKSHCWGIGFYVIF